MHPQHRIIPGTDTIVAPQFLDKGTPQWNSGRSSRELLAEWVTRADNPYFARAAVNRLWAHFFGIGLVDPVDDLDPENPASHPELLDEVTRQFVDSGFDLKFLIRAITASRAYQLSSETTHATQAEARQFTRMAVKGLSAEQLWDSLVLATGFREPVRNPQQSIVPPPNSPRAEFLERFAERVESRTEQQTSILQALALMNGRVVSEATSLDRSETLAALLDAPFLDTAARIEALYLATLTRRPRPGEIDRMIEYANDGGSNNDPRGALADIFWALLNSAEFILNH